MGKERWLAMNGMTLRSTRVPYMPLHGLPVAGYLYVGCLDVVERASLA